MIYSVSHFFKRMQILTQLQVLCNKIKINQYLAIYERCREDA